MIKTISKRPKSTSIWSHIITEKNIPFLVNPHTWKNALNRHILLEDSFTHISDIGEKTIEILVLKDKYLIVYDEKCQWIKLVLSLSYVKCEWI